MLVRVKEAVENVGGHVIGVVLNNVDVRVTVSISTHQLLYLLRSFCRLRSVPSVGATASELAQQRNLRWRLMMRIKMKGSLLVELLTTHFTFLLSAFTNLISFMKTLLKYAIVSDLFLHLHAQIEAGGAIKIAIQGVPVGEQEINGSYPVSDKGYITMWKIGTIKVVGSETDVLARKIEAAYRDAEIYTSPVIQILADSGDSITVQTVTVEKSGRQAKPYRGMTLYQAVMSAGGPTEFGGGQVIFSEMESAMSMI